MTATAPVVHVAHIIFRFDFGGLENGLVNLVNELPPERYRHSIISLTRATEIATRLRRGQVEVYALDKRPGKDPSAYWRLYRLLRRLRPDVVHTRNLGTLDCQPVAWAAGVPRRIHGEHGWDVSDPDGSKRKSRLMRRALMPFVGEWIALSRELEGWLAATVGVPVARITRICNGVDVHRFQASAAPDTQTALEFGTVTRFSEIKDPLNTLAAFARLLGSHPHAARARLTMVGDGPLLEPAQRWAREAGIADKVLFPGSQLDVAPWLRRFHVFVLGSRREGISNTILEAMASGLPVIATDTGGNPELVASGTTGFLVPPGDAQALAAAMVRYLDEPDLVERHGTHASARAREQFSIERMVAAYDSLYRVPMQARPSTDIASLARK